jgi:pimeloyl-ACP methyl ester carboxylesterase
LILLGFERKIPPGDIGRMSDTAPKQERIWNVYGQAMGAAIGLELVLRIANITARFHAIEASEGSRGNKQAQHAKVGKNAGEGTFGQVASQFCKLYPQVADSDPVFREAIENAVGFRNHLTHGFLAGRIRLLQSERGLDLIALECHEAMNHFQRIEHHIRDRSGVDFSLFAAEGDDETLIANHPLAHMLDE